MALKLWMCIWFGVEVQPHRQRSLRVELTVGFGPACKWKLFGNAEDWNVFLLLLCSDGVWLALLLLPLQSPCHTCSQLLPALKLQTFLVHLAFYIERWKYILVICGRTIMSHAGKIVFMVPAGKQVLQFQSTTVFLFLLPPFVSRSNIVRTSCPCWVEPEFLPSLK